jgi:multidrug efflux pump
MSLSSPFINRPIATSLLAVGIAIAGIVAFDLLPVAPLPQIDFPTINVQASLPGASPETMASSVATPLERQLGFIAGVTEMTSTSALGSTRITLQFDLNRDIDGAARDVQSAINAAQSFLPANLPSLPTYRKVNPADAPIMIIALSSDKYSPGEMYDVASSILQQKLSQVSGIGQVIVGGSSLPAVRVELNPTALNSYGISIPSVASIIQAANVNTAKGQLSFDNLTSDIMANDQLFKAKEYAPLIITYKNNSPVRISDVAEVVDSVQDVRNMALTNGKSAIVLILFKEPGANVIEAVGNVRRALPFLKSSISQSINMDIMMDRTATIRASLEDVEITLFVAMILVVIVTFLFLGSLRAMLIPGVVVPLSLLGTFGVMQLLGFSLDNLSLMALTISTGFVVDDAVVVMENIARHLEMGVKPKKAALEGAKEVGFTVVSMSLSLIAVFIPILLMGGIVGRIFREFAITLSVAILVSLFISLTITPVMCAGLLRQGEEDNNRISKWIHTIKNKYETSLSWALNRANLMILLTLFTIITTIALFYFVPKGFFPQQDTGRITGAIQAQQNLSFQSISTKLQEYVAIIKADPAVENVVGVAGSNVTTNSGSVFITLKALADRGNHISSDGVLNRLRPKLAQVTGSSIYLQSAQDLSVGARQSNAQYLYTLTGDNVNHLTEWSNKLTEILNKTKGFADVSSDMRDHGLQVYVDIDRDTAYRYGISAQQLDSTLYGAFGQSQVSRMYTPLNQYFVVMEVAPKYWQNPETLDQIYVFGTENNRVPLSTISSYAPSSTLLLVNHQGLAPAVTISFNLLPGFSLGDAVNAINGIVKKINMPSSIQGSFQGTAQAFLDSLANEPLLILAALLAVYLVLGILYESLIHPVTILSTLPSAGLGALLALLLTGTDLSIIALIGILLLIGIVKKNAIMMIDFALSAERLEGKSPQEAIFEAAVLRFRPIMMTTLAALFGALPLVVGIGLGSELRRPLGIAIVGGLIVSQMMTLYTTPVIYLEMEKMNRWWRNRKLKSKLKALPST